MPRLFFALVPPPAVLDALDDLCEGMSSAHWVSETDFHLTLAFLGDVPEHLVERLSDAGSCVRGAVFRLELESVGVFSGRRGARVLWAGVRKEERLLGLQRALAAELRHAGFELEQRKFHPHVTLARIERCPEDEVADWVARHLSFRAGPFGVFEFHLLSSVRPGHGSRYPSVQRFPLRA